MKKHFFFLLMLCAFSAPITHAEDRVDSLTNLLQSVDDTSRVDIYYKLFWEFISRDLNEAERVAVNMLDLALSSRYNTGIGMSYDAFLNLSLQQGDFEKAKKYINLQKIHQEKSEYEFAQSAFNQSMGQIYYYQTDYDSAIFHFSAAAEFYKINEHSDSYSRMLMNLGSIYHQQSNYEQALDNFFTAEKLFVSSSDYGDNHVMLLHNIALVFFDIEEYDRSHL